MYPELTALLNRRLAIIADHAWRDRDSAQHLDALREVSEQITSWTRENRGQLDPQLRHFMANCSFDKALAHIANQ